MMQETGERANFREQCQGVSEILVQGHQLLDDLVGPEAPTDDVPQPVQSQGTIRDLDIALIGLRRKARDLLLRLEVLSKEI